MLSRLVHIDGRIDGGSFARQPGLRREPDLPRQVGPMSGFKYAGRVLKLKPQQVGQAGEHFVAAELHRRGAYAVTFSGNMPNIDILASDVEQTRTISVQVKTKTTGTWHSSTLRGEIREEDLSEARFWILVDIGRDPEVGPGYWIVPEWWMLNHIHVRYHERLAASGGKRIRNPDSTHFAIIPKNVEEWRDRWDLLGIF